MPIWLIIMIAGVAGCGFLFLKAREIEKAAPYKKIKMGNRTVKKVAKQVAKKPSTMPVHEPLTSFEEINMSPDLASTVARDLEEVMRKKNL